MLPDVPPYGAAPCQSNPYTVNAKGQGPAWASSLFEDNAEFGFGMFSGTDKQRKQLATVVEAYYRLWMAK